MEAMTLEQSAYLAEIVGVFAIVVSLVYLSLQVRQNTRTTRLETVQTISSEFNNFNDMLASSGELADIYHRGVFDFQSLNTTEQVRFSLLLMRVFRTWYEQYFHWRKGALDAEFWHSRNVQLADAFQYPGWQWVWSARRHQYAKGFQEFIDNLVTAAKDTKPLYEPPPASSG